MATFLGHVIDEEGVKSDLKKHCGQENGSTNRYQWSCRFLGIANQLTTFNVALAAVTAPFSELLQKVLVEYGEMSNKMRFETLDTAFQNGPS